MAASSEAASRRYKRFAESSNRKLRAVTGSSCQLCGAPDPRTHLSEELLCDRCLNMRMSELTGYRELPSPPPPLHLIGPDGRGHTLSFRVYRGLVGVQVELERLGDTEVGYRFEALGNHDADVDELPRTLTRWPNGRWGAVIWGPSGISVGRSGPLRGSRHGEPLSQIVDL